MSSVDEIDLLNKLLSPEGGVNEMGKEKRKENGKGGERNGAMWEVAYTANQGVDGQSSVDGLGGGAITNTRFRFSSVNGVVQPTSQSGQSSPLSVPLPLPQGLSGDVERKSSVGSFPFLVSTGSFTASSRSVESSAMSGVSTRTGSDKEAITIATKCRIGLDLSFSDMKYLGFISQATASSSDARTVASRGRGYIVRERFRKLSGVADYQPDFITPLRRGRS